MEDIPTRRGGAPRLLLHVQHLLGTGHLRRMAAIAAALAARGGEVTLMSGGMPLADLAPPAGVRFVQLPPMRATDATFRRLLDAEDRPVDEPWRAARRPQVLGILAQLRPDLVLIEHFPFGRRMLEFELLPLIVAARALPHPACVASSVRDVLVAKPEPEKRAAMVARAHALFDHVLFHGDFIAGGVYGGIAAIPRPGTPLAAIVGLRLRLGLYDHAHVELRGSVAYNDALGALFGEARLQVLVPASRAVEIVVARGDLAFELGWMGIEAGVRYWPSEGREAGDSGLEITVGARTHVFVQRCEVGGCTPEWGAGGPTVSAAWITRLR